MNMIHVYCVIIRVWSMDVLLSYHLKCNNKKCWYISYCESLSLLSTFLAMDQSKVLEQKLQDAENSIKYMKEEHQCILEGLHNEISTLQQKCSGMLTYSVVTFKLFIANHAVLKNILNIPFYIKYVFYSWESCKMRL